MALIRRLLDEGKRDPATFSISKRVYIAVDDQCDRAEQRLRRWFGARYKFPDMAARGLIFGSRAECVDKLGELVRAGAQHLLLHPVYDHVGQMELLPAAVGPPN